MKKSEIVNQLMFDYDDMSESQIISLAEPLSNKFLRWLGANHPDNKTRKIFFKITNISIGADTVINRNFIVSDDYKPLLTIGDRVAISPNVTVVCASAPNNSLLNSNSYVKDNLIVAKPVSIGNDVWIGSNAIILPGVTINANSIIGAGAVVSSDVTANAIYVGIPAKFIKQI